MRAVTLCSAVISCLLASCGETPPKAPAHQGPPRPPAAEFDFGVIPHGESRTHDYVLDVRSLGTDYVPLRAQLDCSCGRAQIILRDKKGNERLVDGSPTSVNAPTPDETLIARLFLDTITKDAVDLPHTTTRGSVLLQPLHDRDGSLRVQWPLIVHFGIESPVELHPFAAIDFERVPQSRTPEILTNLRGDAAHRDIRFGAITCTDPAIVATLQPDGDHFVLRTRCTPGEVGNHNAVVSIATSLESGYKVNVGVQWKVVPDLEARPMAKLSFLCNLTREQRKDEIASQFLLVADHDPARGGEFAVHKLVDDQGHDARSSFEVTFVPIAGPDQQHRMFLRYLGGQPNGFRGSLVLGKGGATGPFLTIELVVFAGKNP
jgi:hypothetical protein